MTQARSTLRVVGLSVLCLFILSAVPAVGEAQTVIPLISMRTMVARSTGSRAPIPLRPPAPTSSSGAAGQQSVQPAADSSLAIDLRGSFSALADGDVAVSRAGNVLAVGEVNESLTFSAGGPVNVVVTATGLLDQPSVTIQGVALAPGQALTRTVSLVTGLVRVEATLGGRRISGVARFYRIDPATGQAAAVSCGSMGATGVSREISAGRYLVTLSSGGQTLTSTVEITGGDSRLVSLGG